MGKNDAERVADQQRLLKVNYNETVIHVINLYRLRPVNRDLFIKTFQLVSQRLGVDFNCVIFFKY